MVCVILLTGQTSSAYTVSLHSVVLQVIVKERHETIMGYKPRERVALEWFIPIIVELLVLKRACNTVCGVWNDQL